MKRRSLISIVLLVLALAACEKDGAGPTGSGELGADDKALFAYLPANATAVFGGNYMKLQDFMSTTLGKTTVSMMEKYGPGMSEWMKCFTQFKDLKVAGAANVAGKGIELHMVMAGAKLEDVQKCAAQSSFKTTVDTDSKYIAVELPGPAGVQGYLVTPSGALYVRQSMIISAAPVITPSSRTELEADLKAAATTNVLTDAKMQALIAKADRSKTVWFAGSGANTPIAGKLGDVFGTFDLGSGLAIDVTAQITDAAALGKLEDGVAEIKKMSDQLPGNMKDIVSSLQFSRKGDRARFAIKLDDKQLADLVKQAGMFGVH